MPLTKLPVQICLKGGFNPANLYQVVYTAKDPLYVLGIGFAAWRDIASFFKYADQDDVGTANPLAGSISRSITVAGPLAVRQSTAGAGCISVLIRTKRSAGCTTACGPSSRAAGSRSTSCWAQPDGALALYQAGSEGPQWWVPYPDETLRPADAQHP